MYAPDNDIRAFLKLNKRDITLTEEEEKALDKAARGYRNVYLTPFCSMKQIDLEMFLLLKRRILNIALDFDCNMPLEKKFNIVCHSIENKQCRVHASFQEERYLIQKCQEGREDMFTYIYLLMGHKVVTFMYAHDCFKCRFLEVEELFNEFMIKLYTLCNEIPFERFKTGGMPKNYLFVQLKHFYRELAGKNDLLVCSGSARARIEKVAAFVKSIENDFDGTIPLSFDEIKAATGARDNEIFAYFSLRDPMFFDQESSYVRDEIKDESSAADFESLVTDKIVSDDVSHKVAQCVDLTKEEIDALLTALVNHVDDNVNNYRGKITIRRLSKRSVKEFCKEKEYDNKTVARVLEEYAYLHTNESVNFA